MVPDLSSLSQVLSAQGRARIDRLVSEIGTGFATCEGRTLEIR
jgi:hypothetical protein